MNTVKENPTESRCFLLRKEAARQMRCLFKGTKRLLVRHRDGCTIGIATYPDGTRHSAVIRHERICLPPSGQERALYIIEGTQMNEESMTPIRL